MNSSITVTLRNVEPADLPIFFAQQLDPKANRMAAFVHADPHNRAAFDALWQRILGATGIVNRTILRGGEVAGHIACYPRNGEMEIIYWLGKMYWGHEIATQALRQLLQEITHRPLFARAAKDNVGSVRCWKGAASRSLVKTKVSLREEGKKRRNTISASHPTAPGDCNATRFD